MAHEQDGRNRFAPRMADMRIATAFLTRLAIRVPEDTARGALAGAAWAFPVIGLGVGLAGGVAFAVASWFGLTYWLAAVIAVAVQLALTGALHEDAVADVADGFGGGQGREAKLSIMRDSRIGSFGVAALVLVFAARLGAIAALGGSWAVIAALMVSGAASRGAMAGLMRALPPARDDGLGHDAGRPQQNGVLVAAAIAGIAAGVLLGVGAAVAALVGAVLGAAAIGLLAKRQIGGQTGDVLGAGQQIAEVSCLCAIIAFG
jgi:adenosylcobinamide-GDP ribazoletransferase